MVPVLARMSIFIKVKFESNILTGNYEMAYAGGLLMKLSGRTENARLEFTGPEDMFDYLVGVMEGYAPTDRKEENLLRMLTNYHTESMWDDQVLELYQMGLEERTPWVN